jgi:hypothetical protein
MRFLAAFVIGSLGLLLGMASQANAEVTYVYAGNPYMTVFPPYTTADSVHGSITLSSALPRNIVNFDALSLITEVVWNDGDRTFHIFPTTPVHFSDFQVSTDSAGNIITWFAAFSLIGFQTIGSCNDPDHELSNLTCPALSEDPFFGIGGVGDWNAQFCSPICFYSLVVDNPGSWTSDAPPPPVPALTPIAFGLLGILLGASGLRFLSMSRTFDPRATHRGSSNGPKCWVRVS